MRSKTDFTKFIFVAALLLPIVRLHSAETEMAGALQKGLFEEEANHNLAAAKESYQAVVGKFDQERKLAATAVFRLGECYRKEGKTEEANQQYLRIVREFTDQAELVKSSQAVLGPQGKEAAASLAAGGTPSAESTEDAEIQRLKTFLQDSPDMINGDKGQNGMTPLQEAVSKGQLRVAGWLLDRKADINFSNAKGTALHIAIAGGNRTVTEFLLTHGANPNAKGPKGTTPLLIASEKGFASICELLIKSKADLNARNEDRLTPLHLAKDIVIAELLLANKADTEACNKDNRTPLVIAVAVGDVERAKLLMRYGAEVNKSHGSRSGLPMFWAIDKGNKEMVELLLKSKADPNLCIEGDWQPLLIYAIERRNKPIAEMLMAYGADVNKGSDGGSSLNDALRRNDNMYALEFLLSHGADPNLLTWSRGIGNAPETPLTWALSSRDADRVELLLKYGADPNRRNAAGNSPLDCAFGQPKTVDLLRAYGASEFAPAPGRILVLRKGFTSFTVFTQDAQGYNRPTLLDALQAFTFKFADLSRIVIHRALPGKPQQKEIAINLLKADQSIDLSKDIPLEFGDIIEIPERAHSLGETDGSLSPQQKEQLEKRFKRTVTFKSGSRSKEITLDSPKLIKALFGGRKGIILDSPNLPPFGAKAVDDPANKELLEFLPSTADFSRIEVTRIDPATKKQIRYTANVAKWGTEVPDEVWLLDGDCIEIPEKK